jgi:predicted ferric reductase
MFRFHKVTGTAAICLAALHPMFLYGTGVLDVVAEAGRAWAEAIGALALLALAVIVCASLWRIFLGLSFEKWRGIHQLTFVAVVVVTAHSQILGVEVNEGWPRCFWLAVVALYAATFVWVKFIKPARLWRRAFVVAEVKEVNYNTCNLALKPRSGEVFDYAPGQFAFITLKRQGFRTEEHHFTLSSSPARKDAITFTIKSSGDFTATINKTKPGDIGMIDGPYGHFSHALYPAEDIVMIAGGIGITPMLGMLRYMADTGDKRAIVLIWGNRSEKDIVFRDEIDAMPARLNLRVHHVLSSQPDWPGEKGKVDEALLKRLLTEQDRRARVFLCGPPIMMNLVTASLRKIGFSANRIHTERFSL